MKVLCARMSRTQNREENVLAVVQVHRDYQRKGRVVSSTGSDGRVSGLGATGVLPRRGGRDLCCWRKPAGLDSLRALLGLGGIGGCQGRKEGLNLGHCTKVSALT